MYICVWVELRPVLSQQKALSDVGSEKSFHEKICTEATPGHDGLWVLLCISHFFTPLAL